MSGSIINMSIYRCNPLLYLLFAAYLGLFFSPMSLAAIDPIKEIIANDYPAALRWENIKGEPRRISGEKTHYFLAKNLHVVRLNKHQQISIHLNKSEMLRILTLDKSFLSNGLTIETSNGTSLYSSIVPLSDDDDKNLIIPADNAGNRIIRISNRFAQEKNIALFVSRKDYIKRLAPYRNLVDLSLKTVELDDQYKHQGEKYWLLDKSRTFSFAVNGNQRIELQLRLKYQQNIHYGRRAFYLTYSFDKGVAKEIHLSAQQEHENHFTINSQSVSVARNETVYIDIPDGVQKVNLKSSDAVFLRVLALDEPDYLFPDFNENPTSVKDAKALYHEETINTDAINLLLTHKQLPTELYNIQWISTFIAINNELRDSALDAISLLENSAEKNKGLKQAGQFSETIRSLHTFYRNLLPYENVSGQTIASQHFILYPLKQWNKPTESYFLISPHFSNACESLNQGYFFILSNSKNTALSYSLPERVYNSRLRVIVDQESVAENETFYLQFDDEDPVEYTVSATRELPLSFFDPSTSEACVSHSLYKTDVYYPLQLGHDLTDVAYLDVKMPANANRIKIWNKSLSGKSPLLKVALQYQTSKPYKISQQSYIDLTQQFKDALFDGLFLPFINNEKINIKKLSELQRYRLTQGWVELKKYLLSRKKLFSSAYANTNTEKKSIRHYSYDKTVAGVYDKILSKRNQNQWLEIIELFTTLQINPEHKLYAKLHEQFYHALEQVGEINLRERMLKGAFFFDANIKLRQSAFDLLKKYYEEYNFESKLTQLLTTKAYMSRDEVSYRMLVLHLIEQGHNAFALQIGLLLKLDHLLIEKLLYASLAEKDWQFFDYLLDQLHEPSKKLTWKALKSLALGDTLSLKSYLSQLQGKSSDLLDVIGQVTAVLDSLNASDPETFKKQWQLWSKWKLEQDNGKIWRTNTDIVSRAEGTVSIYNIERNLFKSYFRASKQSPVELSVIGPARIRIGVRLMHADLHDEPKKSILVLNDNKKQFVSTLLKSVPSQGLQIVELPESIVGSIQYFEYAVGDGIHNIEYYVQDYTALTTISTQKLAIGLELLPDILTPELLDFIGSNSKKPLVDTHSQSRRQCQNSGCIILFNNQEYYLDRPAMLNEQLLKKQVLAKNVTFGEDSQDDFYQISHLDVNYLQTQFSQLCLFDRSIKQVPVIVEPLENFSKTIKVSKQRCIPKSQRAEKAVELLAQMHWYFLKHPESQTLMHAMAGSIQEHFSSIPHINRYSALFEQQFKWVLQSNIQENGGIRFDTIQGWQPVSTYARIRKALYALKDVSLVLMDDRISGITLSNHVDSQLKITIKNLDLPFHYGQNLSLRYQLDEQAWKYIEVEAPKFEKHLTVFLPSGSHSFKIQWLKPILGQFVSINLYNEKNQQIKQLYNETERYYHIATEEEPVRTYMNGPARLRIDYQTESGHASEYAYIPEGLYKLTLPVIKNNDSVLYRIYKHIQNDNILPPYSPVEERNISQMPFSQWYKDIVTDIEENEARDQDAVQVIDKYALGLQEDGTFALGLLWTQGEDREDITNNSAISDYYEYSFSHYYFVEEWRTYFDNTLLYRDHDSGEPSYGLRGNIFSKPDWLSFALRFNWAYFTQEYDSPKGQERAWSTNFRLGIEQLFTLSPKWSHLPKLTVFHKNYNNSGFNENVKTDIDYDVWNEYGEIHDRGLILSDTLYYYPWLDTRLSSGFSYYSDEDYRLDKPEHLSLRVGWLQILDRFLLDVDYSWTYYFSEDGHDWNRSSSSNKGVFNTNLYWDSWLSPKNRLLGNLKLSYDNKADDMTATIGFNYYFDQGRGFRDFRPHTQSFRDLRERHRFWEHNNLLIRGTK